MTDVSMHEPAAVTVLPHGGSADAGGVQGHGDKAGTTARLGGAWVLSRMDALREALDGLPKTGVRALDLSSLTMLDTAGAWLILTRARDASLAVEGASPERADLLAMVSAALESAKPKPRRPPVHQGVRDRLEQIGRETTEAAGNLARIVGFFGLVIATLVGTLFHPSRLRLTSLVFHMQQVGLAAVPIVALMSFLIGIVLAYQGADQLRQFGAEIFVVDLIAVSILRELGILLTAIIVAGRSASAFTAAIGSMKMREEVDAMRTLGLDPIAVLVLPRMIALVLMLPVLGVVANLAGLTGGALMSWIELDISPATFRTRLLETDVSHFVVGIVKAPFFAVIIAVIGCFQGMQVQGNAESLGALTSRSVVQSIFMVILVDAVFSIFFAAVGL